MIRKLAVLLVSAFILPSLALAQNAPQSIATDKSASPEMIWWDNNNKLYGFFICFRDWGSGCEIRGTAHWERDVFVNDYTENIKGKPTKMRDSFIDITPNSHTLVAAVETSDGKMRTLITTRSTRR